MPLFLLLVWYCILTVRFRTKFCRSESALLPAHLDAMAIGLNPPSIFVRAISFAPKKGLGVSGILSFCPFGKDIIALYKSKSVTKKHPHFRDLELQIWLA